MNMYDDHETHIRIYRRDKKILDALSKKHRTRRSPKDWIHHFLELWVNSDPENNIQMLYACGITFDKPIPGYAKRWDDESGIGDMERPRYIVLDDYIKEEKVLKSYRIMEVIDEKTGNIIMKRIREKPVEFEFFDEGYEGGKMNIPMDEEDEEDGEEETPPGKQVKIYRDIKTDKQTIIPVNAKYTPSDDEKEVIIIVNKKGEEREILVNSLSEVEYTSEETIADFYQQENGDVDIFYRGDNTFEEIYGEDLTRKGK